MSPSTEIAPWPGNQVGRDLGIERLGLHQRRQGILVPTGPILRDTQRGEVIAVGWLQMAGRLRRAQRRAIAPGSGAHTRTMDQLRSFRVLAFVGSLLGEGQGGGAHRFGDGRLPLEGCQDIPLEQVLGEERFYQAESF